MKKFLILPALLLASVAQAQINVLKIDIFQPTIKTLALSFEHKLSESSSFQIGLSGTFGYKEGSYFNSSYSNNNEPSTSGVSITPEYRFYLSEKYPALEGFYVAPYGRYQYLSLTGFSYNNSTGNPTKIGASLNAFGLGVIVGRHWIFKKRFSLDIYMGPGYTVTSISSDQPGYTTSKDDFIGYSNYTNYDLRGGATFGIAF